MTNFNYLKLTNQKNQISKTYQKNSNYIVFLHGFMSNLEGKKPKTFLILQKETKWAFLHLNTLDMENHWKIY